MEQRCDNCGFPIRGLPARIGARVYCCLDCAEGGPCNCKYTDLPQVTELQWPARSLRPDSQQVPADNAEPTGRPREPLP